MSSVNFHHVTKRFGATTAVDSLDLDILDGEFMVLLGPSGCGKSTALRMIAGLDEVTEGEIRIGDDVVNDVAPQHRDVSMVFQSYALYPHMTVRKNIESPLSTKAAGPLSAQERAERVSTAAAMLGLEPYLDRKPGALSGGQRQRVALARAIVRRPRVFLMDEPLSNLDAKLRTQTRLELVEMWRQLGTTFVYVTHDQVEAMTMGTRIAVLADGKLQQVGPPQEVYDRPANTFVAGFIGSPPMNMLDGKAVEGGAIETAAGRLPLGSPGSATLPLAPGDGVTVGIRPEHLHLGEQGLSGTVVNVEMLGHERHVIVQVGEALWTIRDAATHSALTAGSNVTLAVDAERVHLFSAGDGRRLDR